MPSPNTKLLRLDIPTEVWERLNAEAMSSGQKIGKFTQDLIVARDARKHKKL
jgi:hypothetical protein